MGLLGVGLANVLAGQASKHTRKMVVTKSHPLQPGFWEVPTVEDVVLDAAMGACIFKVCAQEAHLMRCVLMALQKAFLVWYRQAAVWTWPMLLA